MVALAESGRGTFIVSIVMGVVATLAVVLRMVAKSRVRLKSTLADMFCLAGLVLFYAYIVVLLHGTVASRGTLVVAEFTDLVDQLDTLLKYIYTTEILMTFTLTSIKISILLWYWSIFAVTTEMRVAIISVGSLCVIWCLTFLFALIFQCHPVEAAWDVMQFLTPACIPIGRIIVAYESTNMILDAAILSIPIQSVIQMRLEIQKKILVSLIFALGGFVTITCGVRLLYLNFTALDIYHGMIWSSIEIGMAIVCACLPTMRPLVQRSENSTNNSSSIVSKWYGTGYGSSGGGSSGSRGGSGSSQNDSTQEAQRNLSFVDLTVYQQQAQSALEASYRPEHRDMIGGRAKKGAHDLSYNDHNGV